MRKTVPRTPKDLQASPLDLKQPSNLVPDVVYNDTLKRYIIGTKMGDTYLNAPIFMTPEEYRQWKEQEAIRQFFRKKNTEAVEKNGKDAFDFTDMHFSLGPAEKIFGKGGVRIQTQGNLELKLGATYKNIENPSLPIRNRKTTNMDFDEQINVNVRGQVGDKVNMNLNYNTDATFDFDAKNFKLKYDGKEDEIIKLAEAGNISFPSNSSLVTGAASLFGIRTDMQFGKLKLQLVASQKKSVSKSVTSQGGVQLTPFNINATDYEENRHFFLARFFRDKYDAAMTQLPNLTTGIHINRIEVWVTNKAGITSNTRNVVALAELGENSGLQNTLWTATGNVPANSANNEYATLSGQYAEARNIDQTATVLDALNGFHAGTDYEKLESARLLNSNEYTVNEALGYISLKSALQTDQVLAVAYEYTYGGATYRVGEFANDLPDARRALFVKALKNTGNNPRQPNWKLMMKNVYYLASSIQREKFRLDVKFRSDTTGVSLTYIPEQQVKEMPLLRLLGADRLDNNNRPNANGYFDFIEGYTISDGRVFFPKAEPFGSALYNALVKRGMNTASAAKYSFQELYDSTKTTAKQLAEKNKYSLVGAFRGTSANVISLEAYNVPQGSVVVTAGGSTLKEGIDYSVDYAAGEVTILNQSVIETGTPVNVSLESNTDYGQTRKTMFGLNWEYEFSKQFRLSGTLQRLSEQALTNKVNMGSEPLNNTLWGLNIDWKTESQWLTSALNAIPFLHLSQPSSITFRGEFAHLIAGQNSGTQDNASYLDDFESTKSVIDISQPYAWSLSSTPSMFAEYKDRTQLTAGYNRSLLAWYNIDPLFTRRNNALTPSHIKSDLNQLSNFYVREVYTRELFPQRDQNNYGGTTATLPILNLAFYPNERGPYNFNPNLNSDGTLPTPTQHWGGMMRKLDTNDFETANIEYIEFWLLDPFIYERQKGFPKGNAYYGGDFYINLGEISEDILPDGKKFYESGLPADGSSQFALTQWGKVPTVTNNVYAFATESAGRARQDVGLNGLSDDEERSFSPYQPFLNAIRGRVNAQVLDSINADPANDNYHYFRGSDYDRMGASILRRYKYINNPQGNSPASDNRTESYDTSYKTTPDVEDLNQDYTLNEYEKYYEYRLSIRPADLEVGRNFIVDKRETTPSLRNGDNSQTATWYQFRIPLKAFTGRVGGITDFTSIRFMRMFLTGFSQPIVMRFANLDLVRGEWRTYEQNINRASAMTGTLASSAVSIEENSNKQPVNYVLPPGIVRNQDPSQPQMVQVNEQALSLMATNLSAGESKAVYKNTRLDLRRYKRLQMFVHANALEPNETSLADNELAVFLRLGSDYTDNYYEYEIPLKLTAPGVRNAREVWPEANFLDIPITLFTQVKKQRNMAKAQGLASFSMPFSSYDADKPGNKVTVMGNPGLGEITTMMIGVRNKAAQRKSGEVWVNELRLKEYNNNGGWAAQGNLNIQLSDFGSVNLQGRYVTEGFGGIEQGVNERSSNNQSNYNITAQVELGKLFPSKARVSLPLYYTLSQEELTPKYNPLDNDMLLSDALQATASRQERDSLRQLAVLRTRNTGLSLNNVRVGIQSKRHPMPYDPANFTFSYSQAHRRTTGETTVYEDEKNWRGALSYNWTPQYTPFEPFKGIKTKSKNFDILKQFAVNWLPQNVAFNSEITRNYYELQERDMENLVNQSIPVTFSSQFLWNRDFFLHWDLTKHMKMNFRSATHAEIEEPFVPVNKALYPTEYEAWKDSVNTSLKHLGTPLDYNQSADLSYQLPLYLIPLFDWVNTDLRYNAQYAWTRGATTDNGTSLGNNISNNHSIAVNSTFNLERLYNKIPFLKKANERFSRAMKAPQRTSRNKTAPTGNNPNRRPDMPLSKVLPKNAGSFEKEITLRPDTTVELNHGKKSKRLLVSAKTTSGKRIDLKYKTVNENTIRITNKVDSAIAIKVTVKTKEPLDNSGWYKTTQTLARLLMMVRTVSVSYQRQGAVSLPGFMPMAGDAFGQRRNNGALAPGLDFAFGLAGESFIDRAKEHNWLLMADSIATPATTNRTEDLQIRMSLEPIRSLRIDLNASRTLSEAKNIQYMFPGNPTTLSGTFTMTTLSLGSAFESMGSPENGFRSATFERFCRSLDTFRQRAEAPYAHTVYPQGTALAGQPFDPANGGMSPYSADVLVPAFLSTYTGSGGGKGGIFPTLAHLLPNWTVRYSGLSNLPWVRDVFKSVNLNHAYKSIYAVGAYNSYSNFMTNADGLGFIENATTGMPVPNSPYNVSTISLNESFSPLLGVDMTFQNDLTARLEYRTTRVLSLSMTSVQLNEALSKDWVVGLSYRIQHFNPFAPKPRFRKRNTQTNTDNNKQTTSSNGNNSLNLRLDFSLRKQAGITRNIVEQTAFATSGNSAFRLSFMADYTLSRLVTLTFYLDRQTNTPLLSNNAYPTTTQDFGLRLKLSLAH